VPFMEAHGRRRAAERCPARRQRARDDGGGAARSRRCEHRGHGGGEGCHGAWSCRPRVLVGGAAAWFVRFPYPLRLSLTTSFPDVSEEEDDVWTRCTPQAQAVSKPPRAPSPAAHRCPSNRRVSAPSAQEPSVDQPPPTTDPATSPLPHPVEAS
jgi:hypothetical protein